ncbi:phenylalanine--tRNA ligase subunit beta [Kangiella profundi]|uniref:Phenylalanine--tRNA ligase beta subunit n=1 Tax=Kangiella profundi TaxID=1561924 RepID=A0A2K9AFL7_9GAMM|nr:phenylalanine--tRNA ligase subunit beta [Kangiella profundi]AUD79186.1 phenylalanine--tRNA ligase subunit beta [Kangiella profundi]GGF00734.1 phenylalanine--tRNA ligase beta subunit [Kangiella profundi]
MKFSEKWLREWVNPEISTQQLVEKLTMAGLEVDGFEYLGNKFSGVVVGEILEAEQHPDADKLRVCKVSVGPASDEELQIICGAPNARAGIKVAVAMIGAVLPGDFKIKKAKLRGIESQGMLCSSTELEIGEDGDGILELDSQAPLGQDMKDYFDLNDHVIEVDLTPNRGDCLGIRGIAREVGVLTQTAVTEHKPQALTPEISDVLPIKLSAPQACPRYLGRVIKGINPQAKTPDWMVKYIERSGVRSIDPVVDVTNYVLLELGHPMHAFDLKQIEGGIDVRMAKQGEKLTLLDGQEVELTDDTLLIADHNKPLAIAGVMGGEHSGINSQTDNIFLESAYFDPIAIAGRARQYGLHTDASHRYERGVDFELQRTAMERATELLLEIVGGQPGDIIEAVDHDAMPSKRHLRLRRQRIERVVGFPFADDQVQDILTRLGLKLTANADGWDVVVPSFRFDIDNEESLIEELVRVYGYNKIPSRKPQAEMAMFDQPENRVWKNDMRDVLVKRGYQEVITYSFVEPEFQLQLHPGIEPLSLMNPISSEMAVMRTNLLPGLVNTAKFNINRQQNRIRIFELGLRFINSGDTLQQIPTIAGLVCGLRNKESWNTDGEKVDFYDLKGDVEALLQATNKSYDFETLHMDILHPGQAAEIVVDGHAVGYIGKIHPQVQQEIDLDIDAFVFQMDLAPLSERKLPEFKPLSKFPSIRRDLALVVEDSVKAGELLDFIVKNGGKLLTDAHIFDIYKGEHLEPGKKSIALAMTLRHPDKTLEDAEINAVVDKVVSGLAEQYGAVLRN